MKPIRIALALLWFAASHIAALPEPVTPLTTTTTAAAYLRCLDAAAVTMVSAHRGGPEPGFPENAIETFANTLGHGPFILEVDVRRTADGVYVLMHDETLDRTTTGRGRLDRTRWATLQNYRLVDNDGTVTDFRVPSLLEALQWSKGRTLLQLDVKADVDIAALTRFVAAAGARDRAALVAYTMEDALAAAAADPEVSLSVEIDDRSTLSALIEGGLSKDRLIAWTGVSATPRPALWALLEAEGVPAAFGALWHIDSAVAESGNPTIYADLAEAGVDLLATDFHRLAADAIRTLADPRPAIEACTNKAGG